MLNWKQDPHRRFNPLTGEWVLVSPHRTDRPWQGQVEKTAPPVQPEYDPQCYLCPGNARAGGVRNPAYTSTFVFDNDFAALKPDTPIGASPQDGLLVAEAEPGICRVVCFSPKHNLTIANMEPAALRVVVDEWAEQYAELGAKPFINYVQIFENRGAMMGASNPHPHCQIWSNHSLPNEIVKEQAAQLAWRREHGTCLLCEYARIESAMPDRKVEENDGFLAVVPFWAVWPFEVMIVARRHYGAVDALPAGNATRWRISSSASPPATTGCSTSHSPIRWGSISVPPMARCMTNGISTCTSTRPCCAPRRCASFWWDMKCWRCRSATSRPRRRPSACATCKIERAAISNNTGVRR